MKVQERQIQKLVLDNGTIPFDTWLDSLANTGLQVAVDARLARVRAGNFGDFRSVGDGVFELRIHKGPGFRVYFGLLGATVVVLLGGGDKSTQQRDIKRAKELWRQFKANASKKLQGRSRKAS